MWVASGGGKLTAFVTGRERHVYFDQRRPETGKKGHWERFHRDSVIHEAIFKI